MCPNIVGLDSLGPSDLNFKEEGRWDCDSVRKLLEKGPEPRPTEPLVYWEIQGYNRMCALHCLNNVMQGPVFTEIDLSNVALMLDERERQLLEKEGSDSQNGTSVLAGGKSLNGDDDGFFSYAVIEECLRSRDIMLNRVVPSAIRNLFHNLKSVEGLIINKSEHWFSARRLGNFWYILNSLHANPKRMTQNEMLDTITQDCDIFLLSPQNGCLPRADPHKEPLFNKNQFYLTQCQIEYLTQACQDPRNRQILENEEDTSHPSISSRLKETSREYAWPTGSGRTISERNPSAAEFLDQNDLEDPLLTKTIEESMLEYIKTLPKPPEEPQISDQASRIITIQIVLLDQSKIKRKLYLTHKIIHIFHWVESEIRPKLDPFASYALIAQYPRREFRRITRSKVTMNEDQTDISCEKIEKFFECKEDQLIMKLL